MIAPIIFHTSHIILIPYPKKCNFVIKYTQGVITQKQMKLLLLTIFLLGLAFAGIAIKLLTKKNGKFAGTCSSNNPLLQKEGAVCGLCGAKPKEQCKNT